MGYDGFLKSTLYINLSNKKPEKFFPKLIFLELIDGKSGLMNGITNRNWKKRNSESLSSISIVGAQSTWLGFY